LIGKGWSNDELPKSIVEYWKAKSVVPHNGKLTAHLTNSDQLLHRGGYYEGLLNTEVIRQGLKSVEEVIRILE